jgi:hypothetical protein
MDIITNMLKINESIRNEMIKTVMKQNYFQCEQKYYKQTDGLAMGAPTTAVFAEAYIKNMEHKQIYPILIKHQIIRYFRYGDIILIIYDRRKTNIEKTLTEFNKQQRTIEKKLHSPIIFLNLPIYRREKSYNLQYTENMLKQMSYNTQ